MLLSKFRGLGVRAQGLPGEGEKPLRRRGQLLRRGRGDADLGILRRIDREDHDAGRVPAAGDELVVQAHAETGLHHGKGGAAVHGRVADVRRDARAGEHARVVRVLVHIGRNGRLGRKRRERERPASGQRVLRRQPRDHGVGVQRDPVKVALAEARDAEVGRVLAHGARELAAVALQDLHLDAGVNFAKAGDAAAEPAVVRPVDAADGDRAGLDAADLGCLRVEQTAPVRQLPQRRQQRPAGARRLHAAVRAAQQWEAQLLLERRHHPAQAGGGIVQFFRRRREAPGLEHGQQCAAFFRVHKLPLSLQIPQGTVETLSLYAMI